MNMLLWFQENWLISFGLLIVSVLHCFKLGTTASAVLRTEFKHWPPPGSLIFHQSPLAQEGISRNHSRFRFRRKQSILGKESNCKCTIDAADFPQKSYILFFSFWNWQLTKSTTCGKSFITLGLNQTINNGLLFQNCTGVRGTINYYTNKKITFGEIQCSYRTFGANWLNWGTLANEMWIMRL